MKKIFAMAAINLSVFGFSQVWTGAGDMKAQAGINVWGFGTGPTATFDYGVNKLISVGAGAHAYFNEDEDNPFIFGRIGFHLQETLALPPELDIYPGANVGIAGRNFGLGVYLGARYFFTENWGAFIEAGNNGSFGVSYSF